MTIQACFTRPEQARQVQLPPGGQRVDVDSDSNPWNAEDLG